MTGEARLESAVRAAESAGVALLLIDPDGHILYANAAAEPLLGRSRRKLVGVPLDTVGPWGELAADMAGRARDSGREVLAHDVAVEIEGREQRGAIDAVPDGSEVCVSIRPAPPGIVNPRGEGAANAAVGFGRMLSHELKNPLAGARGAAQLIAQTGDEESADLARLIVTELDRARRIAEHWSRIGDIVPGPPEPVNLHALAREAIASARAAAPGSVAFSESFDPSLPEAWGDRDLLLQAVLNLLTNAAEAVGREGEGEVRLVTRYRRLAPGAAAPEARLEVEVVDTGPGVPEHLGESVFNPFVTGKPAGEGLGLAFVSRVAGLHGGAVEYDSRPGRTAFRLFLSEAAPR